MSGDPFSTAQAWESAGRFERAIAEYERLIHAGVGRAEPFVRRAILHKERGELSAALSDLEDAERLEPQSPRVALALAQAYTSIGRDIFALNKLQQAILFSHDMVELKVNFAAISSRLNWYDVSYKAVCDLPEGLPDWWAQARKTGLSQYQQGRRDVLDLLPRRKTEGLTHEVCWQLAVKLTDIGRLTLARRLCDLLISLHPKDFGGYELLSRIIARVDGPASALGFLRALGPEIQACDEYPLRTARCLLELGRFQEVLQELAERKAVASDFGARFMTAVGLFALQEQAGLELHCQTWMEAAPQEVLPCGIICCAQPVRTEPEQPVSPDTEGLQLIQFWDSAHLPPDVDRVMASWSDQNPGLVRRIFNEEEARHFLRDKLGTEFQAAFDICHHAAMKADYFRIAYLLRMGGVYVDADECCLRPMASILVEAAAAEITAVRSGDLLGYLHNFFLAAHPNSRPLALALDDATAVIHKAAREGVRPSIWEVTGPGLITRAVGRYLVERRENGLISGDYLIPLKQYRSYVRNASELGYKHDASANWQLQ